MYRSCQGDTWSFQETLLTFFTEDKADKKRENQIIWHKGRHQFTESKPETRKIRKSEHFGILWLVCIGHIIYKQKLNRKLSEQREWQQQKEKKGKAMLSWTEAELYFLYTLFSVLVLQKDVVTRTCTQNTAISLADLTIIHSAASISGNWQFNPSKKWQLNEITG